jgi:hypothetical protein
MQEPCPLRHSAPGSEDVYRIIVTEMEQTRHLFCHHLGPELER